MFEKSRLVFAVLLLSIVGCDRQPITGPQAAVLSEEELEQQKLQAREAGTYAGPPLKTPPPPPTGVKKLLREFRPFKFNFTLPDLEGNPVSLADFKGKNLMVVFWSSSSEACQEEIATLNEFQKKHGGTPMCLLAINCDVDKDADADAKEPIVQFAKEHEITYQWLFGDAETRDQVPGFGELPVKLFIDFMGAVRLKVDGAQKLEDLDEIINKAYLPRAAVN